MFGADRADVSDIATRRQSRARPRPRAMARVGGLRYARVMTRGTQIKWVVVVALALVLVGINFYPRREPAERTENALRPPVSTLDPPASGTPGASPASSPSASSAASSTSASTSTSPASVGKGAPPPLDPRAAARRQRVLDALASSSPPKADKTPGAAGSGARVYPEGTMADKTGNFREGVAVLNRDFIPLVGECYDHAHERNPRLGGILALSIKLASAEGVGGIIESVEPAPGNQVRDTELIECVRQSAFSVEFPESATSGRKDVELTIPFGPPPTEDAGATKTP